jgi:hypothetical protein
VDDSKYENRVRSLTLDPKQNKTIQKYIYLTKPCFGRMLLKYSLTSIMKITSDIEVLLYLGRIFGQIRFFFLVVYYALSATYIKN